VDDRTNRNVLQRQRVARLDVSRCGSDDGVANFQALRRDDVGQLAVLILDQRDEGRAVRVVFKTLDGRRNVPAVTLEVDLAVQLLGATADTACRDAAFVVASALLGQALGELP
jgi:hypothetical protein